MKSNRNGCSFLGSRVGLVASDEGRGEATNSYKTIIEIESKEPGWITKSLRSCNRVTQVLDDIQPVGNLLGFALLHVLIPFLLIEELRLSVVVPLNQKFAHATSSLNHSLNGANNTEHDSKEPALCSSP